MSAMTLRRVGMAVLICTSTPTLAFDDKSFCVAAQQLAIAAEKDIGIWIDRVTRNAGMNVLCDRKVVESTRFTYLRSSSMTERWKATKASEWNATQCNSALWREAIDNGWTVLLHVASPDGGRATLKAQCQ
jgi:hypothetical protein